MRIGHVALWVPDVDAAAEFWSGHFEAVVSPVYSSARRVGFASRFVRLPASAVAIELMQGPWVEDSTPKDRVGWAHIAICLGSNEAVDAMAKRMADVDLLVEPPRTTGDGFYEAVIRTPEGILIELTS